MWIRGNKKGTARHLANVYVDTGKKKSRIFLQTKTQPQDPSE